MKRLLTQFGLVLIAALAGPAVFAQTITTGGTVNAADYTRAFAPGALVSIFGTSLATSTAQAPSFPLPTTLAGATVELVSTGAPIPIWYASPTQINAQLPYDVPVGQVQLRVRTLTGVSNTDTIAVTARAPKIFTVNQSGIGLGIVTNTNYQVLTAGLPARAADNLIIWMNSMGATTGTPVAGQPAPGTAPGSQALSLTATPTVTLNGAPATVSFAGLTPGSSGLYQVNIRAPFIVLTGEVTVQVTIGGVTSQASVTVPYQQMGYYYSVLGGKSVSGQTLNGVSGATSALAFRHSDPLTWGPTGNDGWTKNTGLGANYSVVTGVALTLRNGATVVYDNNGIETSSAGTFYNNAGGGANNQKPGLTDLYSMSNYFPLIYSGYFRLAQPTVVSELIGYFDALGGASLRFDPQNPYLKYRMNIWSNAAGNQPKEAGFVGDVFTTDTASGSFTINDSGVKMISSNPNDLQKVIYRLSYKLNTPITLPAGEYWFAHDASVRAAPASSSTAQMVSQSDLSRFIRSQDVPDYSAQFNFFGRDMTIRNSWALPIAVEVHPALAGSPSLDQ